MNKYHFIYKTTNLLNGKYYIGVHNTNNLDDGYLGSGKYLKIAIKKYGKDNFKREILEYFDSYDKAFEKEKIVVNEEFVNNKNTYNIKTGGDGGWDLSIGKVSVKDKNGNQFRVSINDSRYLSGELIALSKGRVSVKDENGNTKSVPINSSEYKNGKLKHINTNLVAVRDKNGNQFQVDKNNSQYLSGELIALSKGRVLVENKEGNTFMISCNDEKYLSGELKHSLSKYLRKKLTCPYCGKTGDCGNMHQNHFEYCPKNPNKIPKPKKKYKSETCPYCGLTGNKNSMTRYHFENCKHKPK